MATESKIYQLKSSSLIYTPGMLRFWINGYRTQPELMFWQMVMGFPTLPAALISDVLSGRCPFEVEGEDAVIQWGEPMGEWKDYYDESKDFYRSGD